MHIRLTLYSIELNDKPFRSGYTRKSQLNGLLNGLLRGGYTVKKILALLLFMMVGLVYAQDSKINKLIFFGDSLTDNGNLYSLLLHIIPKSPPYFEGRFSNGQTWAEYVGKYYYNKKYASYKIYAVGGATTVFHFPTPEFISPANLELEIDKYLLDSAFSNRSQVLFSIWIGGNDYVFYPIDNVDASVETDKVVNKIAWSIEKLRAYGGNNFLIMNLPDLARLPQIQDDAIKQKLHNITILHNQKLDAAIQNIQQEHPEVQITMVNLYDLFNDVIDNPDKYNEKYHTNITNTSDSCWKGGYLFNKSYTDNVLANEIQQTLMANKNKLSDVDAKSMESFIMNSPALAYSYQLGKSYERGNVPCVNPDEYIFWDSIHPTAIVHQILAQIVIEQLTNQMG